MRIGLVLYTIELDGCLNGVYSNDGANGRTLNEIARRQRTGNGPINFEPLEGAYDCFYFDVNDAQQQCTLIIDRNANIGNMFEVRWQVKGSPIFQGTGFLLTERQLVVHYTKA